MTDKATATVIAIGAALAVAYGLSGCATTPWRSADCDRFSYPEIGVKGMVCNDDAVDRHCRKWIFNQGSKGGEWIKRTTPGTLDNGSSAADSQFAGCMVAKPRVRYVTANGVKYPVVTETKYAIVGRSYIGCWFHELAHAVRTISAKQVAEKFHCVGAR